MSSILIWLAIFFSGCFWVWGLPVCNQSQYLYAGISLAMTVLVLIWGFSGEERENHLKRLLHSLYFALLLLICQGIAVLGYFFAAVSVHQVNVLIWPCYWLMRLIGYSCSVSDNVLNVWNHQFVLPFSANLEKMAVLPGVVVVSGAVLALILSERSGKLKALGQMFLLVTGFLFLRFVFLITLFLEYENPYQESPQNVHLFSDQWFTVIFIAVLTGLLAWLVKLDLESFKRKIRRPLPGVGFKLALAALALVFFCLAGAYLFHDPGIVKNGRILIDDLHSKRWEKSTVRMGKYDFGGEVVYSYSDLVYLLRHYYQVEINTGKTLDRLDLNQYSVVVLKTPALVYSQAELAAVRRYVAQGGGLFLIGDHTNLLGMSAFLNLIAGEYGFGFNYDSSNQYSNNYFTEYRSFYPWAHPTVMGLDYFSFLTSCTLRVPLEAERAMISLDAFSDKMDYSKPSFFGDIIVMPDDNFGVFALGAAKKIGQGRINLFCDSTVFSNFCLLVDGHDRYLLNSVNFLNRQNKWGYQINWLLVALAALLLLAAFFGARKAWGDFFFWLPLLLLMGFVSGSLFWGGLNFRNYQLPQPKVKMTKVAFLGGHAEFYLPPGLGRPVIPFDVSFDTFFVALQRIGLFPFYTRDIDDALQADALVIINPVEDFSPAEKEQLLAYVQGGGKLLIMDTIFNRKPHLQQLLDVFGIESVRKMQQINFLQAGAKTLEMENVKLKLNTVSKSLGKGTVVVMADSQFFSRAVIGGVMDLENPTSRRMYDIVYDLFEKQFALKPNLAY